jgi:lipopolysaccharide export system permease protein
VKKIDKYIFFKFLGTFVLSISLIIIIVIVFDISEKIEDFVSKKAPLKAIIFDYYFNFIPYFVNLFSSLFTFIAVIFFTSRMAANTEIVAILSNGISFWRMLYPYLVVAVIIAVSSLLLSAYVIPEANKKRIAFEELYYRNKFHNDRWHMHFRMEPGTFAYIERYDIDINYGYKFSLEKISHQQLYYKLLSDGIKWDTVAHKWQIQNYIIRKINGDKETIVRGAKLDTIIALKPQDFGRKSSNIETMTSPQLSKYINEEKLKGSPNLEIFEIEKYKRTAMPFATLILTLIGVSLSSRKVRGGIGIHIGLGLLISFSYILFMQISSTFAISGQLSPFISVWIPNILYSLLAWYLLKKAPK